MNAHGELNHRAICGVRDPVQLDHGLAGLIPEADSDGKYESALEHGMHALRHFYASALLDVGENIKAVSEYLGHADPVLTLRVYAHLMPDSRQRARRDIDTVFQRGLSGRSRPTDCPTHGCP